MGDYPLPPKDVMSILRKGVVIPAHPLALTRERKLDVNRQQALTRYYVAAGAGGVAVGVHTTQFEVHNPKRGLYESVLELAAETIEGCEKKVGRRIVKVAGISGSTKQAVAEATLASDKGYHVGLLSLSSLKDAKTEELLTHCRMVAEVMPIFGFYLQPAVGGQLLSFEFWRQLVEIENLIAIKIAPFNRYDTLSVIRAVAEAGRSDVVALYTGNDDNIVNDLLTTYSFGVEEELCRLRIVGGLLGQWSIWTRKAVELLERVHSIMESGRPIPQELIIQGVNITDANGAIFDAAHNFAGCIPGVHEILRRQGFLEGIWCLNPNENLSPGQIEEIDRVCVSYPHLNDDDFVSKNIDAWMDFDKSSRIS